MSSSPAQAPEVPQWDDKSAYAKAIARTDNLINQGLSFSGREPNCFFLNKGDGTFAAAGAVTGWDFPDDSRAIGLVDWDGDGDLDAWISNRNAPQFRFLRNDSPPENSALLLLLEGRRICEAPGARVTVTLNGQPPLVRTVKLGEGYEGQNSRWLHFGLGKNPVLEKVSVAWPGGPAEEVSGCKPGGRFVIAQGSLTAKPAPPPGGMPPLQTLPMAEDAAATLLTGEQNVPPIPALTYDGKPVAFSDAAGPTLIHLWNVTCADCGPELRELAGAADEMAKAGLRVVLISATADAATRAFLVDNKIPFTAAAATDESVRRLRYLHELLFGTDIPLTNPSGILLDGAGHAAAIYRGRSPVGRLLSDVRGLNTRWPERASLTLPFPGQWIQPPGPSNPLTIPGDLAERGYLDESLALFQRHFAACAKQQGCAQVLMALAAAFEKKGRFADAIATYRLAHQADASFPGALNNLAWHLAVCPDPAQRKPAEALPLIRQAASLTRRGDPEILDTLATVAAVNQQWSEAEAALTEAIAIAKSANRADAVEQFSAALQRIRSRRP